MNIPQYHSLHAYNAFDTLIQKCQAWARPLVTTTLGYSAEAITKRIIQRTVELGSAQCVRYFLTHPSMLGEAAKTATHAFANLSINGATGQIKLNKRLQLHLIIEFLKHWSYVLYSVTLAITPTEKSQKKSAALLFGVGIDNVLQKGMPDSFLSYCQQGPIMPLREANHIIVDASNKKSSSRFSHVLLSRFPAIALLKDNSLSFMAYLKFFIAHCQAFGAYFYSIVKFSPAALLSSDFSYHALIKNLNDYLLIQSVVITNSAYSNQALWMTDLPDRHFKAHMIWYSQNTRPVAYLTDGVTADFPQYRHIRADTHWVWDKSYANYLNILQLNSEIIVVGPILFYLPLDFNKKLKSDDEIIFKIFDVNPVKDEIRIKNALGDYYCTETMILFLREIVETKYALEKEFNIKIKLILKSKRAHHPSHDPTYIALLKQFHEQGDIELVTHDENLYTLISNADMVITIPYSSPVYIASKFNIPSVFFDPTQQVLSNLEDAENIYFAAGKHQLQDRMLKTINTKLNTSYQLT